LDAGVLKVEFGDVLDCDAALAETTSKLYVVFAVRPVNVTEWAVTSVGSIVELDPYPVVVP
jgi:hypothetical protein